MAVKVGVLVEIGFGGTIFDDDRGFAFGVIRRQYGLPFVGFEIGALDEGIECGFIVGLNDGEVYIRGIYD